MAHKEIILIPLHETSIDTIFNNQSNNPFHIKVHLTLLSKILSTFVKNLDPNINYISRSELSKILINYIKDNNLQNSEKKFSITLDEELQKIFPEFNNEDNRLNILNLQNGIVKHWPKRPNLLSQE